MGVGKYLMQVSQCHLTQTLAIRDLCLPTLEWLLTPNNSCTSSAVKTLTLWGTMMYCWRLPTTRQKVSSPAMASLTTPSSLPDIG